MFHAYCSLSPEHRITRARGREGARRGKNACRRHNYFKQPSNVLNFALFRHLPTDPHPHQHNVQCFSADKMVGPQGNPNAPVDAAPAATNRTVPAVFGHAAPAATDQAALAATYPAAPAAMIAAATYTAPPVGQPGHASAFPTEPTGPAYRPPPCAFDKSAVGKYMKNMGATHIYRFCLGCGQEADLEHLRNFQHCPGPCWRCRQVHTGTVCSTWDNWQTKTWWSRYTGVNANHLHRPGGPLEHIQFTHGPQDQDQGHGLAEARRALGNIAREVGTLHRVQSERIDRRSNQDARSRSARQPPA